MLDDWNHLTVYESKGKSELDQDNFVERIELNSGRLSLHDRRHELRRVQSNAIFQFEVTVKKGSKKQYVLKAPSKNLRAEWMNQIKWRLAAQLQVAAGAAAVAAAAAVATAAAEVARVVAEAEEEEAREVEAAKAAKKGAGKRGSVGGRLAKHATAGGKRMVKRTNDGQIILSAATALQNKRLVELARLRSNPVSQIGNFVEQHERVGGTKPVHRRDKTQEAVETGIPESPAGTVPVSAQEEEPNVSTGPFCVKLSNLLARCKATGLNTKTNPWVKAATLAFNPRGAAPEKQHTTKVLVLRLASFSVVWLASFVICQIVLSDTFSKSVVCVAFTALSMVMSFGYTLKNIIFRLYFSANQLKATEMNRNSISHRNILDKAALASVETPFGKGTCSVMIQQRL